MKETTGDEFRINDGLFHYLVRTFSRTNRKDYENYVLNAVWQGVVIRIPGKVRFLQPVSQQYARRADGKFHNLVLLLNVMRLITVMIVNI